ncbi:MAG: tetratricopeptide repeat protein, partial [Bacteroidia bacterium]
MARIVYITLIISSLLFVGCKSTKVASGKSVPLDYQQQKDFEKVFFEANKQKVLNNKEKALELYIKSITLNKHSHAAMFQVANLNYQLDRFNEALYWAEQTVNTSETYNHWYYGQLAQFYNKFGKYTESAQLFSSMIDNEPNAKENYFEAANQYYNAKEFEKAIAVLKGMQETFGVEMESASRLEFVYSAIGQGDKAIEAMEQLVAEDPSDVRSRGFLAETYLKNNQKEKSIETLQGIIKSDPEIGKAYFALYSIYEEEDNYSLAFYNLKESFKYDDVSLQQKMQAASIYFSTLNRDTVRKNLLFSLSDILLEKYPSNVESHMLRSDLEIAVSEYSEARSNVKNALKIEHNEYKLWSSLFNLNTRLDDNDQQIIDTEEALELFPNVAEIYASKGYAFINLGEFDKSIDIANQGLEIAVTKGDKINLLLCQASAYSKLKKFDRAEETFETALALNPYNPVVLNNYAFNLAERKVNLDKADTLINLALKLEPRSPFYLDTKAWVLYGKKEYEQALKILNKCMAIAPESTEYYKHAKEIFET